VTNEWTIVTDGKVLVTRDIEIRNLHRKLVGQYEFHQKWTMFEFGMNYDVIRKKGKNLKVQKQ
jgi:hypothetical protein